MLNGSDTSGQSDFLKELKKIKTNDYTETLKRILPHLNLPEKTELAKVEALLIYAVKRRFPQKLECDVLLVALGLLKGFANRFQETGTDKNLYSTRRDSFLKNTNYIQLKYSGKYPPYEEAEKLIITTKEGKKKPALDIIRATFNSDTDKCIKKLGAHLYSMRNNIAEHLEAATKEMRFPNSDSLTEDQLPSLVRVEWCRSLPSDGSICQDKHQNELMLNGDLTQRGHLDAKPKTSSNDAFDGDCDGAKPPAQLKNKHKEHKHDRKTINPYSSQNKYNITLNINNIKTSSIGKLLTVVIILLIGGVCYEAANNGVIYSAIKDFFVNEDKRVEQIHIFNSDIFLEPGESEKLKIGIYPRDADIDMLQYSSQDTSVAWAEKRETDWFVVAQSVWQEDANHKTVISVQYRQVVDEKDVTILKSTGTPVDNIPNALGGGENNADDATLLSD